MKRRLIYQKIIATILLSMIIMAGIGVAVHHASSSAPSGAKITVTASFYPLYEFAKQVGGNLVEVRNITQAGAEPHDYEPSAAALAAAQKSQVFIYNGARLEPWVDSFVSDYSHTMVKASDHIFVQKITERSSQTDDPHFWLDPVLAEQIVLNIRNGLRAADPVHSEAYTRNAAAYIEQLQALDADFRSGLATCQTHTFVTSHAAFGYLAQRYGLHMVAIAGVSPDEEPSPATIAGISNLVTQQGVRYIFFESLVSPRLADTIASETGAAPLVLDPLEGLRESDQKQGKNYVSVQRQNLGSLRTALAC